MAGGRTTPVRPRGSGKDLGRFESTAFGPPWDSDSGMEGDGKTADGTDLRDGHQEYIVATNNDVIPLGSKLRITPNPFHNPSIVFRVADSFGSAGSENGGRRIDFYIGGKDARSKQNMWGRRSVRVEQTSGGTSAAIVDNATGDTPEPGRESGGLGDVFAVVVEIGNLLFTPEGWLRIGKIIFGIAFIFIGLNALLKETTGSSPLSAAKKAAKTAADIAI